MARLDDRGDKVRIIDNEDVEVWNVDDSGNVANSGTLTVTGAFTASSTSTFSDDITIADAQNIILKSTTGTKIGTATSQKLGFFNASPVAQRSAYTQTYSTADKTHANLTVTAVATTGASTAAAAAGYTTKTQANNIVTAVNALKEDLKDVKQVVNSVIDDLQALGLVG